MNDKPLFNERLFIFFVGVNVVPGIGVVRVGQVGGAQEVAHLILGQAHFQLGDLGVCGLYALFNLHLIRAA